MKSPIPWIGGKSLLKTKIVDMFPQNDNYNRFIDVFGGGGSILFAKDKHAELEVYNDANSDLVNLFRCIKYHSGELQQKGMTQLDFSLKTGIRPSTISDLCNNVAERFKFSHFHISI